MAFKSLKSVMIAGAVMTVSAAGLAFAAGGGGYDYDMEHVDWSFKGPFGQYDKAAAQRGYKVYREVCANCHQLQHLAFRHLGDENAPFYMDDFPNPNDNPFVKNFAADWDIEIIDSETGDIESRKGVPADKFPPIYPNDAAARAGNGGALPPDLSLMVMARTGGADYLYNLLLAYDAPKPDSVEMTSGLYWNPVMEGGKIAMPPQLTDGLIDYDVVEMMVKEDGEEKLKTITPPDATREQMAYDVTQFLAWSADPKLEQRKRAGLMTMVYLLILSILLWFSYKRVWRNVEH